MGENGNVPAWVAGQAGFGGALSFTNDGANHSYVSVPGNALLEIGQTATNPWTITAWAYENSDGTGDFVANYGRIMVIDDGTALQLESGASGDGEFYTWDRLKRLDWEIGWGIGNSVSPLLDQWEHWAVVYDGTNITLYRDGNQGPHGGVASQPVTAYLEYGSPDQGAILIGSEFDTTGGSAIGMACWMTWPSSMWRCRKPKFKQSWPAISARSFRSLSCQSAAVRETLFSVGRRRRPRSNFNPRANLAPASWADVTNSPVPTGGMLTVTLPVGAGTQFFRLIGP